MDRLYGFWMRFCADVPAAARDFLDRQRVLLHYRREQTIKLPDEAYPYFCVVLDGLVGGYQTSHAGHPVLRDLVLTLDFFTGTEHPFTRRMRKIEYLALASTSIMRIPIAYVAEGQRLHPEIAELFHVMKQRKIDQLRKLVAVYQETDHYARYCVYREVLPSYALSLPHRVQEQLLRMSHASYQRAKVKYLRGGL